MKTLSLINAGRQRMSAPDVVKTFVLFALGAALLIAGLAVHFKEQSSATAKTPVVTIAPASAPAPLPLLKNASLDSALSESDITLYTNAINAQKKNNWQDADKNLSAVQNPVLVSSLLADRYLHGKYTTNAEELKNWLAANQGHPDADSIWNLLRSKFPKEAKNVAPVKYDSLVARPIDDGKASILRIVDFPIRDSGPLAQRVANKALVTIETKSADAALNIINNAHAKHLINDRTRAILLGRAASNQFRSGNFSRAYQLASAAATATDEPFAAHQWLAGISAVHMKQPLTATRQFAKIARRDDLPVADTAAAYYWAAMTIRKSNSAQADEYLEMAAQYDRTFYGILAQKVLGRDLTVAEAPELAEDDLINIPAAQRASAWIALGKTSNAEAELTNWYANTEDAAMQKQVIALAGKWDMPVLQMKMGASFRSTNKERVDFASYPTPGWKPNAGYAVDPALLYAIARQESKFDTAARSPAGAVGVMQLMPTTAHYVTKNAAAEQKGDLKGRLSEPVTSIALGQEYLQYLMKKPYIDNNLLFLAAAYNAGPGKLSEWKERIDDQGNPLLFLESISFNETRNYVEQVFVNYWIYSELMGDESPTLEALASNEWPRYQATNLEFAGLFEGKLN